MELKQNFTTNTDNPYGSDRPMNHQDNYEQPHNYTPMNDDIPPPHTTYPGQTYELSNNYGYNNPSPVQQDYQIKQEVILEG